MPHRLEEKKKIIQARFEVIAPTRRGGVVYLLCGVLRAQKKGPTYPPET